MSQLSFVESLTPLGNVLAHRRSRCVPVSACSGHPPLLEQWLRLPDSAVSSNASCRWPVPPIGLEGLAQTVLFELHCRRSEGSPEVAAGQSSIPLSPDASEGLLVSPCSGLQTNPTQVVAALRMLSSPNCQSAVRSRDRPVALRSARHQYRRTSPMLVTEVAQTTLQRPLDRPPLPLQGLLSGQDCSSSPQAPLPRREAPARAVADRPQLRNSR